jgi:hypothetical protein
VWSSLAVTMCSPSGPFSFGAFEPVVDGLRKRGLRPTYVSA